MECYHTLLDLVKQNTFIVKSKWSPKFTLHIQWLLRLTLEAMDPNDPSVLYRAAKTYYDEWRVSDYLLSCRLERFVNQHGEVSSEFEYDTSMQWSYETFCELEDLVQSISDPQLRKTRLYLCARRFWKTMDVSESTLAVIKVKPRLRPLHFQR